MIPLPEIVYDIRARDGTWCKLPYPGHKRGCPNFPKCPSRFEDFNNLQERWDHWFAVIEEFDLKTHAGKMKLIHPEWTERQCRNLLYWQPSVKYRLRNKAYAYWGGDCTVLEIPEACGINVFATLSKVGVIIDRNPIIVRKVMFIGKRDLREGG